MEQDQSKWNEFSLAFRSWLIYADESFERELDVIEANSKTMISMSSMNEAESRRSKQLYSILSGLLKGRPLRILRSVNDRNGMEVWRQLHLQFAPRTKGRAISLLTAYMHFPAFDKGKSFLENIQNLERVRGEYRKASNVEIADDIQLSVLVRCLPRHVQQHVQLQMREESSYAEVHAMVLSYENIPQSWTDKRIYTELGVVQSYAAGGTGSAPMEIDAVQWKGKYDGKSKGKSKLFNRRAKALGSSPTTRGKAKARMIKRVVMLVKEKVGRISSSLTVRSSMVTVIFAISMATSRRIVSRSVIKIRVLAKVAMSDKLKKFLMTRDLRALRPLPIVLLRLQLQALLQILPSLQ